MRAFVPTLQGMEIGGIHAHGPRGLGSYNGLGAGPADLFAMVGAKALPDWLQNVSGAAGSNLLLAVQAQENERARRAAGVKLALGVAAIAAVGVLAYFLLR